MTFASRRNDPDFHRRAFLRGMGVGAGLVPLLTAGRTQAASPLPKRLLVIGSPNAWVHETFLPTGAAGSLAGRTLPMGTAPLEPHKADINLISGLEYRNYGAFYPSSVTYFDCHHSLPHILTGLVGVMGQNSSSRPADGVSGYRPAGGGPSLDQVYANELAKQGVVVPFPVITAGVQDESCCEPTMVQMSYRGADQPNAIENNPFNLYKRLFANLGIPDGAADKLIRERRSVLDYVGGSIEKFGARMGTEDKLRVQQHLQAVRRLELNLGALNIAKCSKPAIGATVPVDSQANVPLLIDTQFDNIVNAMSCDLTRSASLFLANGGGGWFPSWLNNPDFNGPPLAGNAGNNRNHHDLAHASGGNAEARRIKTILENWFMQKFAALIARFKAVSEGAGTMLDNTLILWVNNMGTGDHSSRHVVWLTAGKAGGALRTGQYLPLGEWATKGRDGACVPQNGVLAAISNALLDRNDATFGDPRFGNETPGLRV